MIGCRRVRVAGQVLGKIRTYGYEEESHELLFFCINQVLLWKASTSLKRGAIRLFVSRTFVTSKNTHPPCSSKDFPKCYPDLATAKEKI